MMMMRLMGMVMFIVMPMLMVQVDARISPGQSHGKCVSSFIFAKIYGCNMKSKCGDQETKLQTDWKLCIYLIMGIGTTG